MDSPVRRVTRSGVSFGSHVLGIRDIYGVGGNEGCTAFQVVLAPLFRAALETSDLRTEREVGDNEDTPLDDCAPRRQSLRLSISLQPQDALPRQTLSTSQPSSLPRSYTVAKSGKIEATRNKDRSKHRRQFRKQQSSCAPIPAYRPRMKALSSYADVPAVHIPFQARLLPAGNWIGRRVAKLDKPSSGSTWTLPELLGLDMEVKKWAGNASEIFAVDQGRAVIFLVSRPPDPTWMTSCRNAASAMIQTRIEAKRSGSFNVGKKDSGNHRRGAYYAIPTGVSFGGGSVVPGNLNIPPKLKGAVARLREHNDVKRIAGFQSGAFAFYAPKLYNTYRSYLSRLYDRSPHLQPNFPSCSIFPACTFNLGPGTITVDHTDHNNVAYGLCAITALGNYDPTLGGHLVLFDLGLVIEFPPGTTILIPSSVLRHGNTPLVGEGVQRMSITQYCAGGLFRWVDYGFQTGKKLASTAAGKAKKKEIDGKLEDRTDAALDLFSTVEGLVSDRAYVFGRNTFSKL